MLEKELYEGVQSRETQYESKEDKYEENIG
jgi:hypothetical protein